MTRLSNLNYRETAKAKLSARIKQLLVLMLTAIIGMLISVSVNAQDSYNKNNTRFHKTKYKSQIIQHENACSLLEKKRSVNTSPRRTRESKVVKPTFSAKQKASAKTEIQNTLPPTTSFQHSIIREMVAQHLKEQNNSKPFELAPLYLNLKEDKLTASDMNPFLIALEFALQGKAIVMEAHGGEKNSDHIAMQLLEKIRQAMHEMGVPEERIAVSNFGTELAKYDNSREDGQSRDRRVDFKVF